MKKLNITKEAYNKSRYFKTKYGELKYVNESGKVYKTSKGNLIEFVGEGAHKKEKSSDEVLELYRNVFRNLEVGYHELKDIKKSIDKLGNYIDEDDKDKILDILEQMRIEFIDMNKELTTARKKRIEIRFE